MGLMQNVINRFFGVNVITNSSPLLSMISTGNSAKIPAVTPQTAMSINAVYSCVNLITETKTLVRPKIVRYTKNGKQTVYDHDQYPILTREANKLSSAIDFEKNLVASYLIFGNGYGRILRNNFGRPINYVNLKSDEVFPFIKDGERFYKLLDGSIVSQNDMIHLSDLSMGEAKGYSKIELNAGSLSDLGLVGNYTKEMYSNGPTINGYISSDQSLSPEAMQLIRDKFEGKVINKAGGLGILPFGVKYTELKYSLPLADAGVIEAKKLGIEDIARIYRVPLSLIMRTEIADNKGEAEWNAFLTTVIAPLCLLMQAELDRKIFRPKETDHNVIYELKGIYRTSMKERYEAHQIGINAGFLNGDEVRDAEGMPPTADGSGKDYLRPLNSIPADLWKDYFLKNKM